MHVTATAYALAQGKSKQWIADLARAGRLGDAYKEGNVWMIDSDQPMPESMIEARVRRRDDQVEAVKSATADRGDGALTDEMRDWIDRACARGVEFHGGSWREPDGDWKMPAKWWGRAAAEYLSLVKGRE